jgi:hypothetical protein
MVHAPDTSLTPPCDNLGTLCHSQIIQASLVNLLITHPEMCPRFAEFQSVASAAALAERSVPGPSAEEFIQELAELMGAKKLPSQVISNHSDLLRHGVQGSSRDIRNPQELLVALTDFFNICFPRTYKEWLELSVKARESAETWQVISDITERVLQGMQSGVVPVDLWDLQRRTPELAFALCMMILSDFLALNTTARPTLGEVIAFARSCGLSFSEDDDQQRMQLTTMLLFHPVYQGKRESRVRRENPFAFVVRSELASPPDAIPLLPEIDVVGQLIALRVGAPERRSALNSDMDRREQARLDLSEQSPEEIIITGMPPKLVAEESPPQRPSHCADATPERIETVRKAVSELRIQNGGKEPTLNAVKKKTEFGTGAVTKCLDALRETKEYSVPKRRRGGDRVKNNAHRRQ